MEKTSNLIAFNRLKMQKAKTEHEIKFYKHALKEYTHFLNKLEAHLQEIDYELENCDIEEVAELNGQEK